MSKIPQPFKPAADVALPLRPQPPAWVVKLFADRDARPEDVPGRFGDRLTSRRIERFTLLSAAIGDPTDLSADDLADAVARVYRSVGHELERQRRHAVRLWNFVPDIQGRVGEGDRYMAFNVGRFAAYSDLLGDVAAFASSLPTSSAVGVTGNALWIYVLAADQGGVHFENPRQIPPYQYSRRYGPRPPCFARATQLESMLFIGGTASILGEETRHEGDIEGQTRETFANIAVLISRATGSSSQRALEWLRCLRVHVLDARDAAVVRTYVDDVAPQVADVEFVQAPLCRPELLVEIEGLAECP
jgi:enamine deaminase RidA (YjgF/YER057c/UK114 family)